MHIEREFDITRAAEVGVWTAAICTLAGTLGKLAGMAPFAAWPWLLVLAPLWLPMFAVGAVICLGLAYIVIFD